MAGERGVHCGARKPDVTTVHALGRLRHVFACGTVHTYILEDLCDSVAILQGSVILHHRSTC